MKLIKKVLIVSNLFFTLLVLGCSNSSNNKVISSNSIDFDENLFKLSNNGENFTCSPISVKSMLKILEDSTDGNSKKQISIQLGDFKYSNIANDSNISLTNGLFIKDEFKDGIKEDYTKMLQNKYNSELIVDSFKDTSTINNWVSDKTFNMINDAFDDIKNNDFILVNTLAIDLEWTSILKNKYSFSPSHTREDSHAYVSDYYANGAEWEEFGNDKTLVNGLDFACVANKYDLLNTVGEDTMKDTVLSEYTYWYDHLDKNNNYYINYALEPKDYVEKYIEDIKNDKYKYGYFESSTDFSYYVDQNVKVFAKDLKEHNGIDLQYIAVMPTYTDLQTYINSFKLKDIYEYKNSLITPSYDACEDGYVTKIHGFMPEFDFNSTVDLKKVLNQMYINDIFDPTCALFSPITDNKIFINNFSNIVDIKLSNEGIKAASLVQAGGMGAGGPEFDYLYELPYIDIDLNFNNPFIFFIIDKNTNNIWFEGAVFSPISVF